VARPLRKNRRDPARKHCTCGMDHRQTTARRRVSATQNSRAESPIRSEHTNSSFEAPNTRANPWSSTRLRRNPKRLHRSGGQTPLSESLKASAAEDLFISSQTKATVNNLVCKAVPHKNQRQSIMAMAPDLSNTSARSEYGARAYQSNKPKPQPLALCKCPQCQNRRASFQTLKQVVH